MEWLPAIFANPAVKDVAYAAILTVVIALILAGRLIPKGTHDKILAAANLRGDEFKAAAEAKDKVIEKQNELLDRFAEASKTPSEFFGTVMRKGGGERLVRTEEEHDEANR
jgi:hypothetical protein